MHGHAINGLIDGALVEYVIVNENRMLSGEFSYSNGVRSGSQTAYFPLQGKVWLEGTITEGKWDGLWKCYYLDGKTAAILQYTCGILEGRNEIYSHGGELIASGRYENGMLVSGAFVENLGEFLSSVYTSSPIELHFVIHDGNAIQTKKTEWVNRN
jgi:antitoxin component YwqK of YwqJK toxin-antitoxin module